MLFSFGAIGEQFKSKEVVRNPTSLLPLLRSRWSFQYRWICQSRARFYPPHSIHFDSVSNQNISNIGKAVSFANYLGRFGGEKRGKPKMREAARK